MHPSVIISHPDSVATAEVYVFFFFQAEDGIRDLTVTGVQTCALPILSRNFPISHATKSPHAWIMRANWPNLRPSSDGPEVLGRSLCPELHRPKLTRSES